MDFTPSTPRGSHVVHGVAVSVPYVFAEGDVMGPDTATYLNKAIAGSITNVLGTAARKWADAENEARKNKKHEFHGVEVTAADYPMQSKLDERFALYTLAAGTTRASTPADPTAKFAASIAGEKVKELYKAKGFKYKDMRSAADAEHGSVFAKHVHQYIAANPWVNELAASQVKAMRSADAFDLG